MGKSEADVRWEIQAEVNKRQRDEKGLNGDVPPAIWNQAKVRKAVAAAIDHCLAAYPGVERLDFDESALAALIADVRKQLKAFTCPTYFLPAARSLTPSARPAPPLGLGPERGGARDAEFEVSFPPTSREDWRAVAVENFTDAELVNAVDMIKEHLASGRTTMGDRSTAAAALVCRYLRRDAEVQRFRREALRGKPFDDTEEGLGAAWRFITSPMAKLLSVQNFAEMGLCPKTGQVRLLRGENVLSSLGIIGLSADTHSNPLDGRNLILDYILEEVTNSDRWVVTHELHDYVCIGGDTFETYQPLTARCGRGRSDMSRPTPPPWFTRHPSVPSQFVEGYKGSIAGWAIAIVGRLLNQFPADAWHLLEFLLTDKPPFLAPILTGHRPYQPILTTEDGDGRVAAFEATGPITLHVQPWVQPEELADFWRHVRGSKARSPQADSLEMFHFALNHTAEDERFRWQELVQEWEKEHDHIDGENPRATFRNTFMRVREALLPGFRDPHERGRSDTNEK